MKTSLKEKNNSKWDHPNHYNQGEIEVIDFIDDWNLSFYPGNIIKYVARAPYKNNELEDLKKAKFYLDRLISLKEKKEKEKKMTKEIKIEEWSVVILMNTYSAPELATRKLLGKIYNHPDFINETIVSSSSLKEIDIKNGFAITQNRKYLLGTPDSKWLKWLDEQGIKSRYF